MGSPISRNILITKALILLGLMMALSNWNNSPFVYGQQPPAHVFQGKVTVNGRPAPDGTGVIVIIDGRRAVDRGALVKAGNFRLLVPQRAGMSFAGKTAEFRAKVPGGQSLKSDQTIVWEPGGKTRIDLNFGSGGQPRKPGVQIPGAPGMWNLECIARVLGRMPAGIKDTTDEERLRMTRECMVSGQNQPGSPRQPNPAIQQTSQELQNARQELENWKREKGQQVQQQVTDLRGKLREFKQSLNQPVQDKGLELNKLQYQRTLDEYKQVQQDCKSNERVCRRIPELEMQVRQAEQNIERRERTVVEDRERRLNNRERETGSRIQSLESNFARELRQKEEELRQLERRLQETNTEQRRQSQEQRQRQQEQQRRQADAQRQRKMDEERMQGERKRMESQEQMQREEMKRQTKMDEERMQAERKRMESQEQMQRDEMERQKRLDEERMQAERKRMDRQEQMQREEMERRRGLDEERMRIDRDRRPRSLPGEGAPGTPFETEDKRSGRGFFSNNAVGGLGTANSMMDPTMLAVIGIVLTLGATMLQMVKGG